VLGWSAVAFAVLGLVAATSAWAQQLSRLPRVGILSPLRVANMVCDASGQGTSVGCFVDELRKLGYIDGNNVALDFRFAEGDLNRLPALAAALASLQPDVIYTHTNPGADAAASATTTIPIVVGPASEEALTRLAGNLARPSGNVTGVTLTSVQQEEKCLQLLKQVAPRTSRVAVVLNPDNAGLRRYPGVLEPVAARLGLALTRIDARSVLDLPKAFAAIETSGANAIFVADDALLAGTPDFRVQLIQWARSRRLPVVSPNSRVTADGGLASFGTDVPALGRRAAFYVHRILGGAKLSDLPVERPTIYKLSVNLQTAKVLGLEVPQSVLARADEVIR
jgi:putative ABC transport system substrate-binding protein